MEEDREFLVRLAYNAGQHAYNEGGMWNACIYRRGTDLHTAFQDGYKSREKQEEQHA